MPTKLTTEEFIKRAKDVHGDRYDYSFVEYKNTKTKVKIICSEHGIFEQTTEKHYKRKQGCPKCVNKNVTTKEFIKKAKSIHGELYSYSLVEYVNSLVHVKIKCKKHGIFNQSPKCHLKHGCIKCGIEHNSNKLRLDVNQFIKNAKLIHGEKYDYSNVKYITCMKKVEIICSIHGKFEQTPNRHNNGDGCPKCSFSKGEEKVYKILKDNEINFYCEKKFIDCKDVMQLKFDFYLSELNTCIEYHGNQHFVPIEYFGGIKKLNETKKRDKIKEKYCKENNIGLIVLWKVDDDIKFVDFNGKSSDKIIKLLRENFNQLDSCEFYSYRISKELLN